ncbi:hypothetical protein K432DRAFT_385560 [Lepidopterella palustris CBS 459.81]|uniref:Uncharacterized protein n=1 Tax=Lepidopterella palustris CBS 459.81 TaxID=1314670 RepID=A0A8E2E2R4_9PEZI|nr:hypothetical protein K432DRAFT_385560 [Lepidopterella palustris CBS 459.81]
MALSYPFSLLGSHPASVPQRENTQDFHIIAKVIGLAAMPSVAVVIFSCIRYQFLFSNALLLSSFVSRLRRRQRYPVGYL